MTDPSSACIVVQSVALTDNVRYSRSKPVFVQSVAIIVM
jgi:hypothetical protein